MSSSSAASRTLAPPINFNLVCPGVYRSGYPTRHNLQFLMRLKLRTIVSLEDTAYPDEVQTWIHENGIVVIYCAVTQSKEPFVVADPCEIRRAIRILLDPSSHPVLVHSLHGQSRVGVVVGCLRKLQRWSLAGIFEEYRRFAGSAASLLDLQVIELHSNSDDEESVSDVAHTHTASAIGAAASPPKSPQSLALMTAASSV